MEHQLQRSRESNAERQGDDLEPEKRNSSEEGKVAEKTEARLRELAAESLRIRSPQSPTDGVDNDRANNLSSRFSGEENDNDDSAMAQDEPENLSTSETALSAQKAFSAETALSNLEALSKATAAMAASPKAESPLIRARHDSDKVIPPSPPPRGLPLGPRPPMMLPFPPLIPPGLGVPPPGSPGLHHLAPSPNAPLPGGPPVRLPMPFMPPGIDPAKDPNIYTNLLPRPGSNDNAWESLIEVCVLSFYL